SSAASALPSVSWPERPRTNGADGSGRGPALARRLAALLADTHDADARETEAGRERAMRPALATQAADLPVALRLHAAREAAGQDRGLRDADAEGLRHHAQRASLPDHLHDLVLRRGLPASAHAATRSEEHTSELQSLAYLVC